jgi:hypothetical protein
MELSYSSICNLCNMKFPFYPRLPEHASGPPSSEPRRVLSLLETEASLDLAWAADPGPLRVDRRRALPPTAHAGGGRAFESRRRRVHRRSPRVSRCGWESEAEAPTPSWAWRAVGADGAERRGHQGDLPEIDRLGGNAFLAMSGNDIHAPDAARGTRARDVDHLRKLKPPFTSIAMVNNTIYNCIFSKWKLHS